MISKYPDKVISISLIVITLIAVVFLLGAVGSTSIADAIELNWTGCGITKKAFMQEISDAYEKKTGIKIKISGGGATKGMRSAAAGTSDMGGTCRHWLGGKSDKHPLEAKAELIQVAWDALVVIVHPDNPVNNITLDELRKIYDGEIISWKELGGPDKRIALVTREGKDSGVGHMFRRMVFNDPEYTFKARSYAMKSSGPLEEKISRTVTAMGMDGISSAIRSNVKILNLEGVSPSKENIIAGKYSLFRPLYIAIGQEPSSETKKVIDFILSSEGQAIVSAQGTVNLEEGKNLQLLWDKKKESLGL